MSDEQRFYVPFQRFEEVEFVEEGMEDEIPFRAKVRTNLTFAEVDTLQWTSDSKVQEDVWPLFAPFVVGWNLKGVTPSGDVVDIPPPSQDGPGQFSYVPIPLFWALAKEIKLRNMGMIDPKRKSRPAATVATSDDES